MKIILATGLPVIDSFLKELEGVRVVDECVDFEVMKDIIDYSDPDVVIINRYLDDTPEGEKIREIVKAIRIDKKEVRFVILIGQYEEKFISSMVNLGIYDLIVGEEIGTSSVEDILYNPRKEFDFEKHLKIKDQTVKEKGNAAPVERIKSVFKEVITVYSPTSEGSSRVAAHFAMSLARAKKCRVCLVDANPLQPRQKEIFNMNFDHSLTDALDAVIKRTLTSENIEEITKPCKYQRNLDILFGLYDINDYYASRVEQYEEVIEKLKFVYDYVVIDTHSWFDVLPTDAALRKADRVLVPVRGRNYSFDELERYLVNFEKYNDFDTRKFGIIINQYAGSDLTSIEIQSRLKFPVLGYISKHKEYEDSNAFKNTRLMNEYVNVLKAIGIEANKKSSIFDNFNEKIVKPKKSSG